MAYNPPPKPITLVLAGGLGLGSYQAGAYEAIRRDGRWQPRWIAASSAGAVNAALIAGAPADRCVETLRRFWSEGGEWSSPPPTGGYLRHAQNWVSAIQMRLLGAAGYFRPRVWKGPLERFRSLYDLEPMRRRLDQMVDFERLNSGQMRISVATTDLESGELVVFDTASGCRITMDHLLASCGFIPEFAPVEIEGRMLGDGGLSANAPIEAVLSEADCSFDPPLVVIDLFARDGRKPETLEEALERKNDLLFGNQTVLRLEAYERCGRLGPVVYLSYRAREDEAGPEKTFDLSSQSVADRWQAGASDMDLALQTRMRKQIVAGLHIIRRDSLHQG